MVRLFLHRRCRATRHAGLSFHSGLCLHLRLRFSIATAHELGTKPRHLRRYPGDEPFRQHLGDQIPDYIGMLKENRPLVRGHIDVYGVLRNLKIQDGHGVGLGAALSEGIIHRLHYGPRHVNWSPVDVAVLHVFVPSSPCSRGNQSSNGELKRLGCCYNDILHPRQVLRPKDSTRRLLQAPILPGGRQQDRPRSASSLASFAHHQQLHTPLADRVSLQLTQRLSHLQFGMTHKFPMPNRKICK
mmetsp:Transcript_106285/g.243337  ORF Transcript_106285/g.243337 Transcript_106285/m.243337 type:complete len:243 (-) Transcript_106285:474-1202(-)